ncbi:hypothetical protein FRACYDRAFT_257657 [Fragilariopsis cylindrus CCMP1102]|uniref:Uncharacterized protein n=1 Tax=Fragilariopsis cylindrus CCMP1102 TaxID=635003 RepID=A0A1E7EJ00_9STRA|nr:hypothetical protein FRACYDRAFT_257657 [Fragilariopsis cylindrus CCMP1102]|eukprot:OEU05878.1 hypothetical protein FRACYDRAFT_257657 [Fragilariopsis cylindrus CCMP1102]
MTNQQQRQHYQQQQQYFEDDHTIETIANNTTADDVVVEVEELVFIHSVFIKIKNRRQERSSSSTANLSSFETLLSEQYELQEESFFKSWFERKVINNPRNDRIINNDKLTNTNKLSIPKLCGLSSNLQIYFRNNEQIMSQSKSMSRSKLSRKKLKLKPINKMATLLTFNPDTGLYGQLIRGNAYIDILELIYKYKNIYHQYGADFNRDGRTQLLQACSEYKNRHSNKNKNDNNQQQSDDERIIAVNNEKKNVQHHTRTDTGITDVSSSSSHSHSSNISNTNIDNIIGSPKQKRRSKSNDDEYVYSINILDEEISAVVHSRNNSATTVDATKIKLLHPPLHPPLHTIATPSTSTSTIIDSFEDKADEIIFSFQQEVSKTIININDVEFKNNYDQRSSSTFESAQQLSELPSTPTTITTTAGGTKKNNSTNGHSRNISSLSDTSTPKTIKEEELMQDDEESLCDNNNNNSNNTDVETTTTNKKSHRMNQSLPELLLREESLYPDSHLRSVYNYSIHDVNEKEDSKKSVLTHRSLQLHNNEIDINEQQQKQENTDNYNNCPKYYSSLSPPPSPPSPPPPQIPIPGIIVRRLTSI